MWVNAKVFMDLVEKLAKTEMELSLRIKQLEGRVEVVEKRPIVVEGKSDADKSSDDMMKLYRELTDGVKDEKAGRVIYTDGRD